MLKFTLYGNPKGKKNNMRIVKHGNRPALIQSEVYLQYEKDCLRQMARDIKLHINTPVNIKATFYRQNKIRCDITNLLSALHDILVKGEVIADDNFKIVASVDGSRIKFDKENPRVEVEITKEV